MFFSQNLEAELELHFLIQYSASAIEHNKSIQDLFILYFILIMQVIYRNKLWDLILIMNNGRVIIEDTATRERLTPLIDDIHYPKKYYLEKFKRIMLSNNQEGDQGVQNFDT